jgi:SAM-dependent methyltransferase
MPTTVLPPDRSALIKHFDVMAPERDRWIAKNHYYHEQLTRIFSFFIPPHRSVLEVGSGTGQLLQALQPERGVGIDISPNMARLAQQKYPRLRFCVDDVEQLQLQGKFDYVVLSDLIGLLYDAQHSLENLHQVCHPNTRVIISYYNFMWEPLLRAAEALGLKTKEPVQSWLGPADIENLLDLAGFEVIKQASRLLLPKHVPLLAPLCNRYLVNLPLLRKLGLVNVLVARPKPAPATKSYRCSVIIPCRNERGNIEAAVERMPELGTHTELVFVEGNSTDGTAAEIQQVIARYPQRDIKLVPQGTGRGKADAVRKGFAAATGDILLILDADLTVVPEELPKFYDALVSGTGEFIHGSRLVYPMEKDAMRFLNMLGNKFFSLAFTYLLGQRFKDTLCGTKVLFRSDYDQIVANRGYFGDFDPFGDFDLIFGATKLNLKIVEVPIHYHERTYGTTNISRFKHGWLLLQMVWYAMWKIKFV